MASRTERDDSHVLGRQLAVGHTARLDHHKAEIPVDAAGIPEGVEHESALDELEIGLQHGPL
jgi:hypothetical protein